MEREFAGFADQRQGESGFRCEGRSKYKTPRINCGDAADAVCNRCLRKGFHRIPEDVRIVKKRGYVAEVDAWGRPSADCADPVFDALFKGTVERVGHKCLANGNSLTGSSRKDRRKFIF